jgi:hypothetical protein
LGDMKSRFFFFSFCVQLSVLVVSNIRLLLKSMKSRRAIF